MELTELTKRSFGGLVSWGLALIRAGVRARVRHHRCGQRRILQGRLFIVGWDQQGCQIYDLPPLVYGFDPHRISDI